MKRLFKILIFTLCISLGMMTISFAYENEEINISNSFQQELKGFYNDLESYRIYDNSDNDITELFLKDTQEWYFLGDWTSILDYYYDNVDTMTYEETINGLRLDQALTEYKTTRKTLTGDRGTELIIETILKGTIYYDPNTYVVNQVSSPTIVSIEYPNINDTPLDFAFEENIWTSSHISGSYEGLFSAGFSVWGNYGSLIVNEEFGEFDMSFSIMPN